MPTIRLTDALCEPIDLAAAKRHLREDAEDAALDDDIEALVRVARSDAEHRLQRTLIKSTWRHTRDDFPACEAIRLPMSPVLAITHVKYLDVDGALQTLDPSAYLLDADSQPARLTPAYGASWPAVQAVPGAVRITYTAGGVDSEDEATLRAAVPAPVVQWIKLALTDMYERRARSSDKPAIAQNFADGLLDAWRIYGADA